MSYRIPIVMCNDIEPDGFFIDRSKPLPWRGYEGAFEYFRNLRPRLEEATSSRAHFSWFFRFDPQIRETYGSCTWPATNYPSYYEDFIKSGDEIGLHCHAYRWLEERKDWIIDQGNQEWVNHCVQMCFDGYDEVFRRNCESFRFGDAWMNQETLHLVERLGARFDLTVEPGHRYPAAYLAKRKTTGSYLDCDLMPRVPYRPAKQDFRHTDPDRKDGIWVVAVSTGRLSYHYGKAERFFRGVFSPNTVKPQPMTLNLGNGDHRFRLVAEELLNSSKQPFLVLVLRTDAFYRPEQRKNVEACFDYLTNHRFADRFIFSTPQEMIQILGYSDAKVCANQTESLPQ